MADDQRGVYASGVGEIVDDLRREFLEEVTDSLSTLEISIDASRQGRKPAEEVIGEVRRFTLPLRGQSTNLGVPLLGMVALRMEDYLANVKETPASFFDDLQKFIETLTDISEGTIPLDADASKLVRTLPAKIGFGSDDITIEVRNVEVLLVMLHGTATRFVEREMQQCGYRVSVVTSTYEALPLIIRTLPDLVVISAIMPELEGLDLAIGLASMPTTRNIPTALITSLNEDDPRMALLPNGMPIIRKGASFGDDLADALSNLFLI